MEGISPVLERQRFSHLDIVNTKFLVIGGNGYFGYKLVEALVGKGAKNVRVFDRIQTRFRGCSEVDFYVGDICDPASVAKAIEGMDVIYHTASCFGNPPFGSFGEGKLEWLVNVEGTRNVINAARNEARETGSYVKLVYIGSSSAVFNGERDFLNEPEDGGYPTYFVDHYGRTKAVAEQEVCSANSEDDKLLTCVLRPNGIYGEDELIHIPRVRKYCGMFLDFFPVDFASKSDWTFIDNLSFACFLAAEKMGPSSIVNGNLYNITDGEAISKPSSSFLLFPSFSFLSALFFGHSHCPVLWTLHCCHWRNRALPLHHPGPPLLHCGLHHGAVLLPGRLHPPHAHAQPLHSH